MSLKICTHTHICIYIYVCMYMYFYIRVYNVCVCARILCLNQQTPGLASPTLTK